MKNIINLSTKRRLSADQRSPSSGTSDRVGTGTQAGPESKRGKVTDRLGVVPKLEPPNKELLNKNVHHLKMKLSLDSDRIDVLSKTM